MSNTSSGSSLSGSSAETDSAAPGDDAIRPTGAAAFLNGCRAAGIELCFANPGTTELAIVRAFDASPGWRLVPALFEGVCTGAADGYGRMTGRPALTLTHLGPGFANGIANLHNARRARSPIVNLIGDHAARHLPFDAPLTSDIESLARPVSAWLHFIGPKDAPADIARQATIAAGDEGGRIATVVYPADLQADPAPVPKRASGSAQASTHSARAIRQSVPGDRVERVARAVNGKRILLLVGGDALSEAGLRAAQGIADGIGASFFCETFPARIDRGLAMPAPERFPYFPEPAFAAVAAADLVVVAGAAAPVTYFAYPDTPSLIAPEEKLLMLASPTEAATHALQMLARSLGCRPFEGARPHLQPSTGNAPLSPANAAHAIAAWLPEGAIVSVEGGTCGYPFFTASAASASHTVLTNTGGAIGQGLPVAVGASLAAPDRRVVCVQSDGSAQYTVQSLWCMARENLPVTVLITANNRYGVLQNEMRRDGMTKIVGAAAQLTQLGDPATDWVALARGYGVEGRAVSDEAGLRGALAWAGGRGGPALIEMRIP
ncbi:MAG: acetolactate synthase large subunit [Burkholderiaceae bacterium]